MSYAETLTRLIEKRDLTRDEMAALMRRIMHGELTPAQIAGALVALRAKGETVDEVTGAAGVMRELAVPVAVGDVPHLVDTCGTGGDAQHTFNVSTAAALVAAAAGARVAKHCGRSVSSACGSADVLEALGVNLALSPEQVARCLRELGVGFLFAPHHHAAMKHAAPVRRELGVRTMFNILGPLTNPAGAPNQVMGVFRRELTRLQAEVLRALGSRHVMVVHGADGLDELTIGGDTDVAELREGQIIEYRVHPAQFARLGIEPAPLAAIRVAGLDEAKAMLAGVLAGAAGAPRDIVALNAGAAIYVSGVAATLEEGVRRALAAIESGAARARLDALVALSAGFRSREP
jgi:anthranilate phosphoribosyltransferase